jgi:hypothetical protein
MLAVMSTFIDVAVTDKKRQIGSRMGTRTFIIRKQSANRPPQSHDWY